MMSLNMALKKNNKSFLFHMTADRLELKIKITYLISSGRNFLSPRRTLRNVKSADLDLSTK